VTTHRCTRGRRGRRWRWPFVWPVDPRWRSTSGARAAPLPGLAPALCSAHESGRARTENGLCRSAEITPREVPHDGHSRRRPSSHLVHPFERASHFGFRERQTTTDFSTLAMATPTAFPLPPDYFKAAAKLSNNQCELYRALARDRLNATLASERTFLAGQRTRRLGAISGAVTRVDGREWKPVRSKHDLRIYRRRDNGRSLETLASKEDHRDVARAIQAGQPSLLCIGRVEGSLDDVLFGFHNPSQDEMQAVARHVDERILDCASLATIETAADNDRKHPMHFVGLKWMATKMPGSLVVLPRDVCFLEALGVTTDYDGRRVGYYIQHSVDDPMCPPLDERATGVIRGHVYFTYLFRENAQGFVDVFARGVFNSTGLMPKFVSAVASSTLLGLFNVVRCAQAKKLTVLANRRNAGLVTSEHETVGRRQCGICSRRPSSLDLSRPRTCQVCRVPVCSKCRSERTMFARSSVADRVSLKKVDCCITCVLESKTLVDIHPYDPSFSLFSSLGRPQPVKLSKTKTTTTASEALMAPHSSNANDDSAIASSTYSNSSSDSKGNRTTASSSGSMSNRSGGFDPRDFSSRSIVSAGFAESVVDEKGISGIRESEYDGSVSMSDAEAFESDSEQEEDMTDDEAVDVDVFNRDTTPVVHEVLDEGDTLNMRDKVKVSTAYEAFTQRFTLDESKTPAMSSPTEPSAGPATLLEKMMALHTSVQEAYSMTQANQELMAKMMRAK
jgi:hypothetical protein